MICKSMVSKGILRLGILWTCRIAFENLSAQPHRKNIVECSVRLNKYQKRDSEKKARTKERTKREGRKEGRKERRKARTKERAKREGRKARKEGKEGKEGRKERRLHSSGIFGALLGKWGSSL